MMNGKGEVGNHELSSLHAKPNITSFIIKVQRLQWLGHIEKMEEGRMVKAIIRTNILRAR